MQNTPRKNKGFWFKVKRLLLILLLFFGLLNLIIFVTGKSYLYKGVQATYLQGKSGPGIYDSLLFPVRIAEAAENPESWKVSTTQKAISSSAKDSLLAIETTSFMVVQNGEIIHESYYGEHNQFMKSNSFSMAKSFIGLLIGIAIDEGAISGFDALIKDHLPFRLVNDDEVTIRHLLGMSSGLDWSESGSNPLSDNAEAYYTNELTRFIQTESFSGKPGVQFDYASGNSQLLGLIIENATGKNPTEYFQEKVWQKVNAENEMLWSLDHENGIEKTFCCAYATTRDYARIGQLILNNGKWNGKAIISEQNLSEIIAPFNRETKHYGLHFWRFNHLKHPAIYARGILGQYIIVIPSLDVVMVRTGHERRQKYFIPKSKRKDAEFVSKNKYKEYHPLDLFNYFSILEELIDQEID
ncbi:serine hydrolase domain-containing protein [Brumimicrobium aurantiacum]|uniref:Class C beta-lactamase-related serine hydrolase n=1 Tax=Brumimicrobium aurantiacum TaxID=1737063 RepID=A0A3E1F1X3_9FLAO|nr:serine hydrolase [Brumimicrobium aurantiacum]RFC55810.1 class C beta-lactamase-related serine hydrolase [Brumimicrobium aurantiacum]